MTQPKLSTRQYMRSLFQDSLLTGVPQIISADSIARKVLKTLVLCCCVFGFIYQTSEFLAIFWKYPTVLDINVEYPEVIEMPALTFCNLNGIKRIEYCNKHRDKCSRPADENAFCREFPRICRMNKNSLLYPTKEETMNMESDPNFVGLKEYGHQPNVTVDICKRRGGDNPHFDFSDCSRDMLYTKMSDGNGNLRNCYTMFSVYHPNSAQRDVLPVPKSKEPLLRMLLNSESGEYFRPDREPGVIMAIHSPATIANPFHEGFVVRPGILHSVHLKVVEEKLLPSPYETKCQDYRSMWQNRGGKGPLSQDMCVSECIYNASMQQCSCVLPFIMYPHNDPICPDDGQFECFTYNVSECFNICQQPCEFTAFEFDVQERKLEDPAVRNIDDFYHNEHEAIIDSKAPVIVFLKRPEKIVYSHRPQYENVEVFSFMGGYVGMWLGVSLIAVCDFLESLGLTVFFWIRRRCARR